MTDEFERCFGPGTYEERAARLDGEAVADPHCFSNDEIKIAGLLADILGYESPDVAKHGRWLLAKCKNDYRGLRERITALRIDGELEWVTLRRANAYSLRHWLAEEYAQERQAEERRQAEDTTEGRTAKYVTEGVLS